MIRSSFPVVLCLYVLTLTPLAYGKETNGHKSAGVSFYNMASSSSLKSTLYKNIHRIVIGVDEDGAVSTNRKWEQGQSNRWYIEQQRYGADLIQAGVYTRNTRLIDDGLKALDWGFRKEAQDGSFPGTGDPFHSTSLFVEASARALLLLKEYNKDEYQNPINEYTPKISAAAHWLTQDRVQEIGRRNNAPYTHRCWVLAATLGEAGELCNDPSLIKVSEYYARKGLERQTPEGINPEKGGEDSSYQVVGILMAEKYYTVCRSADLKSRIIGMIQKGLDWELTQITPEGDINTSGSTRTGVEVGRSGKEKKADYMSAIQAFIYGEALTKDQRYSAIAMSLAKYRHWN